MQTQKALTHKNLGKTQPYNVREESTWQRVEGRERKERSNGIFKLF